MSGEPNIVGPTRDDGSHPGAARLEPGAPPVGAGGGRGEIDGPPAPDAGSSALARHPGLSPEEVERSRVAHGSNRLEVIRGKSWGALTRESLRDRMLRILLVAAGVVLVVNWAGGGGAWDGVAILVAVAAASQVTVWNAWHAQAEFASLQIENEVTQVRVRRAGAVQAISSAEIVVGDVIELEAGDKAPADGRVVDAVDLTLDESLLTGESSPAVKAPDGDRDVRGGTLVVDGVGTVVVSAVGARTEHGRLREQLTIDAEPTPLQVRLGLFADRSSLLAAIVAALVCLCLLAGALEQGRLEFNAAGAHELLAALTMAVTIVVVAVPEGLPVAVSIGLAWSVRQMARERCLVRRLMACETMGSAQVLCVDKTGTLTVNRMRVERALFCDVEGGEGGTTREVPAWSREEFEQIAVLDSRAHRVGATVVGDPTEGALLEVAQSYGCDPDAMRRDAVTLAVAGFSSQRKRMSTLVRLPGGPRLLVKGAPEVVLAQCTRALGRDGVRSLDAPERRTLTETLDAWSTAALRVLALAYRDLPEDAPADPALLESDLVLVGIVGIGDPIREEARAGLSACRDAGVDVKIVTGDSRLTGEAVARRLGMLAPDDLVLEGAELRSLTDARVKALLPRLRLVARAVPSDKLRLVELLKDGGAVVAVTGDGTNDAPALRRADVGLAMGRSGTDVAREASDIVILDDDISSIVAAIRWGRAIHHNVRQFIQFQLTASLVALATSLVAAAAGLGTPLSVVQLLWINVIMDSLGALALATQPPRERLLEQRPEGRDAPLVTRRMWAQILGLGGLMWSVMLIGLFGETFAAYGDPARATTVFNLFVLMQVGSLVHCRTAGPGRGAHTGLRNARTFLVVIALVLGLQVAIVQGGGSFFGTVPLGLGAWASGLCCCGGVVGAGACLRALGRRIPSRWGDLVSSKLLASIRGARRILASDGFTHLAAGVGILLVLCALALRTLVGRTSGLGFALFCVGLSGVVWWVWCRRHPDTTLSVRTLRAHTAVSAALAVTLVAFANYVAARHPGELDLTASRRFTLSPQTLAVLDRLDEPVRMTMVFRPGNLAREVRDLLAEYATHGRSVEIVVLDPDHDAGEVERLAERIGLKNPQLSSIVVEYRGRNRLVTWRDLLEDAVTTRGGRPVRVRGVPPLFRGEQAITSALSTISVERPPRVAFLGGHDEADPADFSAGGIGRLRDRVRREGYEVSTIVLKAEASIPDDVDVLVQAGPRSPVSEAERARLGAYLGRGGKWLILLQPFQVAGLEPLLAEWGVEVRPLYVVDPGASGAEVGPTTIVTSLFQAHPITLPLAGKAVMLPYATSVRGSHDARHAVESLNLVLSSPSAYGKTDRKTPDPRFEEGRDLHGPLALAVAVEEPRNFYSADVHGQPTRIVAVGNTDFATNAYLDRAANADFVLDAIDWLARREELLATRARPPEERLVTLSGGQQTALYWMALGILPGLIGLVGGVVAWRRRG